MSEKKKVEKLEVTGSEVYFKYGDFTGKVEVFEDEDNSDDPVVRMTLWDASKNKDKSDLEGCDEIRMEVHKDKFPESDKILSDNNIKLLVDTLTKFSKTF